VTIFRKWRIGESGVTETVAPAELPVTAERVARVDAQLAELIGSGRRSGPAVDRLLDMRLALTARPS
jgi:hypothetical protein